MNIDDGHRAVVYLHLQLVSDWTPVVHRIELPAQVRQLFATSSHASIQRSITSNSCILE